MADGSDWGSVLGSDRGVMERTARAEAPSGVLVASCLSARCGVRSALDAEDWREIGQGLPLRAFEARLRCACGARRVRLEPATGELPPVNPAIYRFR